MGDNVCDYASKFEFNIEFYQQLTLVVSHAPCVGNEGIKVRGINLVSNARFAVDDDAMNGLFSHMSDKSNPKLMWLTVTCG